MYSDRVLESDEAKPPIDGMSGQYLLGTPTLDFKVFQQHALLSHMPIEALPGTSVCVHCMPII